MSEPRIRIATIDRLAPAPASFACGRFDPHGELTFVLAVVAGQCREWRRAPDESAEAFAQRVARDTASA
jgi:hypothetical protein